MYTQKTPTQQLSRVGHFVKLFNFDACVIYVARKQLSLIVER